MALFLAEKGYRAAALRGGFNAWKEAGYPLVDANRAAGPIDPAARLTARQFGE